MSSRACPAPLCLDACRVSALSSVAKHTPDDTSTSNVIAAAWADRCGEACRALRAAGTASMPSGSVTGSSGAGLVHRVGELGAVGGLVRIRPVHQPGDRDQPHRVGRAGAPALSAQDHRPHPSRRGLVHRAADRRLGWSCVDKAVHQPGRPGAAGHGLRAGAPALSAQDHRPRPVRPRDGPGPDAGRGRRRCCWPKAAGSRRRGSGACSGGRTGGSRRRRSRSACCPGWPGPGSRNRRAESWSAGCQWTSSGGGRCSWRTRCVGWSGGVAGWGRGAAKRGHRRRSRARSGLDPTP